MRTRSILTEEKLQDIYTDPKFRNQVANAHVCLNSNGEFKHKKTCSFPHEYIVTEEQINLAKEEKDKAKTLAVKEYKSSGSLVFVAMGMDFESRFDDDICNHRVRASFINDLGVLCFLEVGTSARNEEMRVDHAIYNYHTEGDDNSINNFQGLERRQNYPKYTIKNLLEFVNTNFKCSFKTLVVDRYNLSSYEFTSISKK